MLTVWPETAKPLKQQCFRLSGYGIQWQIIPSDGGGEPGHPDPEIGGGGDLKKHFFGPLGRSLI